MLAGLGLEEATFEISPGVAQAHTTGMWGYNRLNRLYIENGVA